MRRLLLFDVDGTLVKPGSELSKLHNRAFRYGFKRVYGFDANVNEIDSAGFTDMRDVYEIMRLRGLDKEEITKHIKEMFQSMTEYFERGMHGIRTDGIIIDGVKETLENLSKNKKNIIGLLTGNVREIAKMKLQSLGIWDYFKFGGFGESSAIRSELVDKAISDAKLKNIIKEIDLKEIYIIGDTPRDIECAKETGVISVAVASGRYSKRDLEIYKPDYLIGNLKELATIIKDNK